MQFLPGRCVELADYGAQDFESVIAGPITLLYGEIHVGTVALNLNSNRFIDASDWAGNDLEALPAGAVTDISPAGTNNTVNGGQTTLNAPSRFV